jgi:hypothetical protein
MRHSVGANEIGREEEEEGCTAGGGLDVGVVLVFVDAFGARLGTLVFTVCTRGRASLTMRDWALAKAAGRYASKLQWRASRLLQSPAGQVM